MKFYFVRHGETESNKAKVWAGGACKSPLTELGKMQAKDLQKMILKLDFNTIYSSPMDRDYKSAQIMNLEKNAKMIKVEGGTHYIDWSSGQKFVSVLN